ncbi:beta-1,6-N-acetylglucosaminyltransferase [Nordella sp. HKS 07]|uniref:beta-1,6-N-acetylglucosaminyltransferase n=1 Tax=Nordella sp. HKS 07 TaxID=2712222 RepID=UPI0013E17163|nr:beta-1,6-N-acetylglucosaminyltransferase [Nordella sp. HKS 07]QIG49745.1 beta-1,6-N-acetylglucosaminyltransferase [Nordella sp. HKS 07]
MTMRIAYLVLAHRAPADLVALLAKLKAHGETYLHVDRDAQGFEGHWEELARCATLPARRHSVSWGGFSVVEATLELIETALAKGSADYLMLLSGACLPVADLTGLNDRLADERGEYIDMMPEAEALALDRKSRLAFYRFYSKSLPRLSLGAVNRLSRHFWMRPDFEAEFGEPHFGSMWWCLSRPCLDWAMRFRATRPQYDKRFRHSETPDESYFQTLVSLSPFAHKVRESLTYVDWDKGGSHPRILSRQDLPRIAASGQYFARKFDWDHDRDLVRSLLDAH